MKLRFILPVAFAITLAYTLISSAAPQLKVLINGQPNYDPSLVRVINGLPYVSIGAISNELNLNFDYDSEEMTMSISNKGKPQSKVVATNKIANATLNATEREGNLEKFRLVIDGKLVGEFTNWKNVDSPTYKPQIIDKDINQDGKNEIIIILTTSYGTGILLTDAHVFQKETSNTGEKYIEKLVDNPISILKKNVKVNALLNDQVEIFIGQNRVVDKKRQSLVGEEIEFSIYKDKLVAYIDGYLNPSPTGAFLITYQYNNDMYEVQSIEYVKKRPNL
ncbi:MAG: hypothetical protein K0S34_1482 [Bacillales bacterium]|jgi:hypothetical protein|nr:hypothetical protein [Bacillales bacterium]